MYFTDKEGEMPFTLVRIDDRYIHGQVATMWMQALPTKKCFVVNDVVVKDQMTRMVLEMIAINKSIALEILGVEEGIKRLVEVQDDPENMWVLFGNPQDVLKAVKEGFKLEKVIVGFMRHSDDKKPIKAGAQVYVDSADIEAMKKLGELRVKLHYQKTPPESPTDVLKLISNM
jgi:mannose/fructose/N-acetylgalactosamine-specific phosphotransferase system component IIB